MKPLHRVVVAGLLSAVWFVVGASLPVQAASFDCLQANTGDEKAI